MKIYFSCSIYGGRENLKTYQTIVEELKRYGEVLNPEIVNDNILEEEKEQSDQKIFKELEMKMNNADIIFAEVTKTSLGVGYEIGYADKLEKNIICIYNKKITPTITTMLRGNERLKKIPYEDINEIIKKMKNLLNS